MLDAPAPGAGPLPEDRDLASIAATIAVTAQAVQRPTTDQPPITGADLLDALVLLRWAQTELAGLEPVLIAAARAAGISWQALAPALGVASRQAAERRYLRGAAAPTGQPGATRDDRVQAERDRRAGNRAVAQWANDNTADLRRLAGQITALTDLGQAATDDLTQLHQALGDADATTLPALLAAAHQHLPDHPDLAAQIDTITTHTDQIRRQTPRRSGETS
ncbi:hypothetical protein [Dactylosporangium sp. CA-092794]|uniref:hypothetical protein n=1 Tax=Dactylosporangium sp. CA-092794 TaxID=3239929 RepID=UPI003D9057D0